MAAEWVPVSPPDNVYVYMHFVSSSERPKCRNCSLHYSLSLSLRMTLLKKQRRCESTFYGAVAQMVKVLYLGPREEFNSHNCRNKSYAGAVCPNNAVGWIWEFRIQWSTIVWLNTSIDKAAWHYSHAKNYVSACIAVTKHTELASDILGRFAASKLGGVGGFWEFSVNACLV